MKRGSSLLLLSLAISSCGETESDSRGADASSGGSASGGSATGGLGGSGASGGSACQDGGMPDAGAHDSIRVSCVVAVVRVTRIDEECSGAGGTHVTFDVLAIGKGGGVTVVKHGDHAYYPPPEGPNAVGQIFVAGIDPYATLVPQPDNPGWCLTGLPAIDGYAHTLVPAASEADGKAKMQTILTGG